MTTYRGTDTVTPGFYFNLRQLHFESIDEPRALPGPPEAVYRRVPMLAMIVVAPFVGLAFVVFLPFVALAAATWQLARKAADGLAGVAQGAARAVRPNWEPTLAFFSRSKPAKKTPADTATPHADDDDWVARTEERLDVAKRLPDDDADAS